jgi:hypothetical protein
MLAPPSHPFYLRYPPGFRAYLSVKHGGDAPFDPDDYLLRVDKNIYGTEDAGRVWFDLLSSALIDDMGFARMPVDRCVFRLSTPVDGVMCACIILVYVDDLLVVGDDALPFPCILLLLNLAYNARAMVHLICDDDERPARRHSGGTIKLHRRTPSG